MTRVTAETRAEIKERASVAIKNEDAQDRWIGVGAFTIIALLDMLDAAEVRYKELRAGPEDKTEDLK